MSKKNEENADSTAVLDVQDLTISYDTDKGALDVVRNINLKIAAGETYGLVGESGSGKTTLARAIVRYLPENGYISSGFVKLGSDDLTTLSRAEMRRVWGKRIAMVHQDSMAAVNPALTIGEQIAEVARMHLNMSRRASQVKAIEMLNKVRMPDPESVARYYAHQLSGGMLQRVLIAIALATNPELIIMDEPTTALDVTTEAVILDLVQEIIDQCNAAILYITHNLGVVARICDRVGVIYAGEIMEEGTVDQVFKKRLHPYTRALLNCVPQINKSKHEIFLNNITGSIPRPDQLPPGCIFEPRCDIKDEACSKVHPALVDAESGHLTACRKWETADQEPVSSGLHLNKEREQVKKGAPLLEARNVKKHFSVAGTLFKKESSTVRAVDDISVCIKDGQTMGIVGESGCGKTTFARCVVGLEEPTEGSIKLEDELLPSTVKKRSRTQLKKLQMIFQNPDASLNPYHTVGQSVARPLVLLQQFKKSQAKEKVSELFKAVNLPADYMSRLPQELSGGEKQRVAIARAFATDPLLMICDEPISSLDVSVQATIMNLLVQLQKSTNVSYLFISHDMAAVRYLSDWIAVVYLGKIMEIGPAESVFKEPFHPYTEALLSAIPIANPDVKQERIRLVDGVLSSVNISSGCPFHGRCPRKLGEICEHEEPSWLDNGKEHRIRCHIPLDKLNELQKPENVVQPMGGKQIG